METVQKVKDRISDVMQAPVKEGELTKSIERQTAKIPSVFFLNLGLGSMAASAILAATGERNRKLANFIGLWVPTFLLLGIYNKLVKLEGSDRFDKPF